ncbi:Lactate utilization protein A [Polystyrenella longa]|uniref:Glycolate oxidase iron-sulfur subunit n=1 Tax=Polystyrenella longa TaxID=2528007 RepID=A0A518CNQ7_9PLAN|nr:heterodisulfide reductase-related iron-sulfur binding cluster [Polystyrenella longa]QDU80860.1 Lactate utilization protein A [Polystyrenella longa]
MSSTTEQNSAHDKAIDPLDPVLLTSDQQVAAKIPFERFLDCIHCGLCTSACPTYLETGDENNSPRGRIYLMRAVTEGKIALTDKVAGHLDLCLDCRSCETACPSGVQYGRLIEPFRIGMQQQAVKGGKPKSWFEKFILFGLFPYPSRLKWTLLPMRVLQKTKLDRVIDGLGLTRLLPTPIRRMHNLLPQLPPAADPLPPFLPAIGARRARVGLFTGCVSEAMFSPTNRATARVLQQNGCDVFIPRTQQCCGAIHYHGGESKPAVEMALSNVNAFAEQELDAVIVNVAGCGAMLKDYHHLAEESEFLNDIDREKLTNFAHETKDVSEFLYELGLVPPTGEIPLRVTYHDACHLVHAQQIRQQPRDLLQQIPGLELIPLPESDICCGAAGSYNLTQPDMADRLGERKLKNIQKIDPQAVLAGNAGCSLQLQATLKAAGYKIPVYHPIDLLDASYRQVSLGQ